MKIFNIVFLLFSTFFLFNCDEQEVTPLGSITLTSVSMTSNNTFQRTLDMVWAYTGNVSEIEKYIIQYSLHHGEWITLQEASNNQAMRFTVNLPAETFYSYHTYAWRVKAVRGTEEVVSCYLKALQAPLAIETPTFGTVKLVNTRNYTNQALMEFDFTPTNQGVFTAGLHPVVDKKVGSNWQEDYDVTNNFIGSGNFTIPYQFQNGTTYRVYVHGAEDYYGKSNFVEFTYANAPSGQCGGDEVAIEPPTVQTALMKSEITNRRLTLQWTHPNPSVLTGFKVQYSLHHSNWIDFATVANTVSSIDNLYFQTTNQQGGAFQTNTTYKWRVLAMGANYSVASCSKSAFLEMGTQETNVRPIHLRLVGDFTVGNSNSFLNFQATAPMPNIPTTGWYYAAQIRQGNDWVNNGNPTPLNITSWATPYTFQVPMVGIVSRIVIYRLNSSQSSNAIEIYPLPQPIERDSSCQ